MVKEAQAAKEEKVSMAIVTTAESVVAKRGNAEVAQRRQRAQRIWERLAIEGRMDREGWQRRKRWQGRKRFQR